MSLAWTTIVVLVILLPGFLYFFGLYSHTRVTPDNTPSVPLVLLAGTVLVSFVIHALFSGVINLSCYSWSWLPCIELKYLFGALQLDKEATPSIVDVPGNLRDYWWYIFGYFILTGSAAFGLGRFTGRLILAGPLRSLAAHNWMYDLINLKDEDNSYTFAYVMTGVREGNRVLMYRGLLDEFKVAPDGHISYLVLKGCWRYYMVLEHKQASTSIPKNWASIGNSGTDMGNAAWSFLMIEGEDIANVVFERFNLVKFKKNELAELDEAIEKAIKVGLEKEPIEAGLEVAGNVKAEKPNEPKS